MDRGLIRSAVALALLMAATPALAQQAATPGREGQVGEDDPTDHLHLPGYEERGPGRSSLTLEIAPELISHNPLRPGTQTSNALDLTLLFATIQPIGSGLEVEFDAGGTKTIDNGSSSSLAANVELRSRPGESGFSGFLGYTIARDYADFFDEGLATTQTFIGGARYGHSFGKTAIGFELAPRWRISTDDADEHVAVNLMGEVVTPVITDDILFILEVSGERRWFQHVDPVVLERRSDWRFATYAGLDLSGAVDPRHRWLHDLTIGGEWLEVSSNFDGADVSDLAFLPAVSIGISF